MTIEELKEEIIEELTAELMITEGETFNGTLLDSKVSSAIRAIKTARNYPSDYPDYLITDDLVSLEEIIKEKALYAYSKVGAEGQTQYSADGESIHYIDEADLYSGIYPIARVI